MAGAIAGLFFATAWPEEFNMEMVLLVASVIGVIACIGKLQTSMRRQRVLRPVPARAPVRNARR